MKIIAIADVHIKKYLLRGQERLENFLDVARQVKEVAIKEKADVIFIAGDLADSYLNKPNVIWYVKEFLTILSSGDHPQLGVYLITGNHEIDREDQTEYRSFVKAISTIDKCHYVNNEEVIFNGDISTYFLGYTKETSQAIERIPEGIDVFVGHGIVNGAENSEGYIFSNGFNAQDLATRFKLSIVGDIHKGQVLYHNVLVPGSLVQNSFSDNISTGLWLIEVEKKKETKLKFIPIEGLLKFIPLSKTNEYESYRKDSNCYFQKEKSKKKKTEDTEIIVRDHSSLIETAIEILSMNKAGLDKESYYLAEQKVRNYLSKIPEIAGSEEKVKKEVRIKQLTIKNFMAIEAAVIDMKSENVLLLGKNGTGKSTLLDFIGWMLFDQTTKGDSVDDLIRNNSNNGIYGEIILEVDGVEYKIIKTRDKKNKDWYCDGETKDGNVKDIKLWIEEKIGVTKDHYFKTIYFSQKKFSFISDLDTKNQIDILKQLCSFDLEKIEQLRDIVNFDMKRCKSDVDRINAELSAYAKVEGVSIEGLKEEYKEISNAIKAIFSSVTLPDYKPLYDTPKTIDEFKEELLNRAKEVTGEEKTIHGISQYTSNAKELLKRLEWKKQAKEVEMLKIKDNCELCGQLIPQLQRKKIDEENQRIIKELNTDILFNKKSLEELNLITNNEKLIELINKLDGVIKTGKEIKAQQEKLVDKSKEELETKTRELNILKILDSNIFSSKGLTAYILDEVGKELEEEINSYFTNTFVNLTISATTKESNAKGTSIKPGLKIRVKINEKPYVKYSQLSGGESRLVDLAVMIALNNMLSNRGYGINLIILDEVFTYFDENYIDDACKVLSCSQAESRMIVTHDENLKDSPIFENVISFPLN